MPSEKATEYKLKGNEALKKGDFEQAIKYYTEGIKVQPNHELYSNRSAANCAIGLYDQALQDANETIRLNPNWSKGYLRLGQALLGHTGQLEDALEQFKIGLSKEPENAVLKKWENDVLQAIEYKKKGNDALKKGDLNAAIDAYTKGLQHVKNNFLLLSNRSTALHAAGRYKEALDDAETVVRLKPTWAKVFMNIDKLIHD